MTGAPKHSALIPTAYAHLWISADHVAREKFSASGLATAECKRAWGYRYLIGLKTLEPEHSDYDRLGPRDKTLAFGKALHARLEAYFKGGQVNWTDDIGQRALVGLHLLPQSPPVRVEEQISIHLETGYEPVLFDGYKDLASDGTAGSPGVLYDYKTTGNFRWVKKPDQLRADPAANIYALDEMQRFGREIQSCRWIYFARNDRPEARPVDFEIDRQSALAVVNGLSLDAANLRQTMREWVSVGDTSVTSVDHLPVNTGKCRDYNGCPYHFGAGGPCQAEATPGAQLIQIDLSNIHEPKPNAPVIPAGVENTMAQTIAERLAAARTANAQPPAAPAPQAPASPFPPAGQAQAPVFAVTAFAPPVVAAPAQSPFPPVAAPVAVAPAAVAPQPPAPPVVPVTAPLTPFAGFGSPPAAVAAPVAPPPVFAGVNPPEQALAAPLPPAGFPVGAPDAGKKKRGRPARAAAPVAYALGSGAEVPTGAGLCDVTITITHENGVSLTIPAPVEIAEQFAEVLGPQLSGMV